MHRFFAIQQGVFCTMWLYSAKGSLNSRKKWFRFVISGYILGTETVSCRLLQGMDMDWNLKKLGQLFQFKYYVFKYHQKNSDCLVLSDEICSISSEHSNDFGTETT